MKMLPCSSFIAMMSVKAKRSRMVKKNYLLKAFRLCFYLILAQTHYPTTSIVSSYFISSFALSTCACKSSLQVLLCNSSMVCLYSYIKVLLIFLKFLCLFYIKRLIPFHDYSHIWEKKVLTNYYVHTSSNFFYHFIQVLNIHHPMGWAILFSSSKMLMILDSNWWLESEVSPSQNNEVVLIVNLYLLPPYTFYLI